MNPYYDDDGIQIYNGGCLEVMRGMEDNSIDTIITDPPYEIGFMGKKWDNSGIAFSVDLWKEVLRIAKPGATLLCFGGTRTWHRLEVAIEDAGWIIRDTLMWLYGSGFPKSMNIGKGVDNRLGNEREEIDGGRIASTLGSNTMDGGRANPDYKYTKGNTEWEGYGTALKPAFEPIIMAMKPNEGSYVDNALKWGVAGLNIDGGKIWSKDKLARTINKAENKVYGKYEKFGNPKESTGRFPTNLLLDEEAARMLDEQSGANTSRFFYVAKASRGEREFGLGAFDGKKVNDGRKTSIDNPFQRGETIRFNIHPTVKPLKLMEYLATLTLMPNDNQIYLDLFAGSGTTLMACKNLNRKAIGIEKETEYCDIAAKRVDIIQKKLL